MNLRTRWILTTCAPVVVGVVVLVGITGGSVLVVAAVVTAVALYVQRLTGPLAALADAARRVERGDLHVSVPVSGSDELTDVCRTFNQMVVSLRQSRRELAEVSRRGGMAEVATGVLHNVGNIVNSVNVAADVVATRVGRLPFGKIAQAASLLEEHESDLPTFLKGPRGRLVPAYLTLAARAIDEERGEILVQIETLRNNVDRIKSVVAMQQAYAKTVSNRSIEHVHLVIADAISMVRPSLDRHHVRFLCDIAEFPALTLDAQRVVQVLANLIRNSCDALIASGQANRQLVVRAHRRGDRVIVEVEDNGVGIRPEDMARLFTFGHTTKPQGHGFGLHMSAIAAQEMGGALTCRSEGPGRGAVFALEIPMESAELAKEKVA